jgi:hypothetical protein
MTRADWRNRKIIKASYIGERDVVPSTLFDESPFEGVHLDCACEKQSHLSHKPTPHDECKDGARDFGDQAIKSQPRFVRVRLVTPGTW